MDFKNLLAEIRVSNQSELDTIPLDYNGIIKISGGTFDNPIQLTKKYVNDVEVIRNACVHAHNDVRLSAWSNAHITAFDNVFIKAFSDSVIIAHGFSEVEAFERTSLRADGNSRITLYDDVYLDSVSVGVTLIDNRNKKPALAQAENEASFEKQNGLALSEKKLIIGESYRLNPKENTEYKVLGIDGEQALLQRNQGRGNNYIQDPTPYVTLPSGQEQQLYPKLIKTGIYHGAAEVTAPKCR